MDERVDPMTQDPRTCEDPSELAGRTKDISRILDWRITARDNQAVILAQMEALQKSAAEIYAEGQAEKAKPAPQSAQDAKASLGRILGRCEKSINGLLNSYERADQGVASQLAHAAANMARTMSALERAEAASEAVDVPLSSQ